MSALWRKLLDRLGGVALIALGVLAAGFLFLAAAIRPLEAKLERLEARLGRDARHAADATRRGAPSAKLTAFYAHFDRQEGQVDWLAKLYGSARASGLDLRAADYRLVESNGRVSRYEVRLPLSGSYTQLRAFLELALDENPVLSLDQLSLRRKRVNDTLLEAEAVLTIHLLSP